MHTLWLRVELVALLVVAHRRDVPHVPTFSYRRIIPLVYTYPIILYRYTESFRIRRLLHRRGYRLIKSRNWKPVFDARRPIYIYIMLHNPHRTTPVCFAPPAGAV